ncbi:MAG TPA: hypothetical protein VNT81_06635 [Vicinamibacterales bacterium]|nr:hypothetical protein [Vicinamibacterales bacterium]
MFRVTTVVTAVLISSLIPVSAQSPQPAATAFERLKAMAGEWTDETGAFGTKGAVVATYRVTGAGNTVIESFPVGTPHEMTTVYHRDGSAIVLTHYCAGGTQPRLRAKEVNGNRLNYEFEGGSNIDVARTSHMHNMEWEFISADEAKATWHNWSNGKPDGHIGAMHIRRKK